MKLEDLKQEIPFKWRVQSFSKYKPECTCVAYIDSRQVQDLLDKVVGAENWQDLYYTEKGNLFCKIGIKIGSDWVWKSDCGTESNVDKEKGEASDSFKRAAVKWGIGRFLYSKEMVKIPANEIKTNGNFPYPVNDFGKRIYDLTKYINEKYKPGNQKSSNIPSPEKTEAALKKRVKDAFELCQTIKELKEKEAEIIEKVSGINNYSWFELLKFERIDQINNQNVSDQELMQKSLEQSQPIKAGV